MPVFVSSTTSVRRHGAYAIEATLPTSIRASGTGVARMVGQLPWGPAQSLYKPSGLKDLYNTFAPPGMTRTGSAYLSLTRKGFPAIGVVRVVASTAVAASTTLTLTGAPPTSLMTVTLKSVGAEGNSCIATVKAASDGVATHFNLEVAVTGLSGSTTDLIDNLNISGTGADVLPTATQLAKCLLVGSVAKVAAGRPTNAAYTFTLGTSPAVAAGDYVGTAGTGDKGLALLERDRSARQVFLDDPGATIRAACNAGVMAHIAYMGDRMGFVNGDSGMTQANTATDVANYRSDRILYVDPWVYIKDDVDGTRRLVPGNSFAASVASQLSPSTSIAWKNSEVQAMLSGIDSLESDRGEGAADNTTAGIVTIIQEEEGGWTFEAGVTAMAPVDATKKRDTRRRLADYIAVSFVKSTRGIIDAPNVPDNQQDIVNALDTFMTTLKKNQSKDPNHTPHVLDYAIGDLRAENAQADLDDGMLIIPLTAKTPAGIEKLFLRIKAGEGVTVS